jgi:hypothetical protein
MKLLLVSEMNWDACSGNVQWHNDRQRADSDGGHFKHLL